MRVMDVVRPTARPSRQAEEPRFLLHSISWDFYELLLERLGPRPCLRLTYDQGNLELLTISSRHGWYKKLLGRLFETLTVELRIAIRSGGQATWKRKDLLKGIEADDCYWVTNERLVRGKNDIDLHVDPPPDIAMEIEVSEAILNRLSVYAALGIGEIWCFDGEALRIYRLLPTGKYELVAQSSLLPYLPVQELAEFLPRAQEMDETSLILAFRDWVRQRVVPLQEEHRKTTNGS